MNRRKKQPAEDKKEEKEEERKEKEAEETEKAKTEKTKEAEEGKEAKRAERSGGNHQSTDSVSDIFITVGALMVLGVLFGGSYYQYQTGISNATTYYVNQKYGQAYDELYHLDIKKDDEYFYGQVNTVMQVYANYRSYAELLRLEITRMLWIPVKWGPYV